MGATVAPAAKVFASEAPRPGVTLFAGESDEDASRLEVAKSGLKLWIEVPLGRWERPLGYLSLRSKAANAYTERDLDFLERMAAQIAPAIENAELYEATRREAEERSALAEIGRIVSSSLDTGEVFDEFAEQVRTMIPFDRISVSLVDPGQGTIRGGHVVGLNVPGWQAGYVQPLERTAVGSVATTGESMLVSEKDYESLARRFPDTAAVRDSGIRSGILVRLASKGLLVGVLTMESTEPDAYNERHLGLAEQVGAQIAGDIANAQLHAATLSTQRQLRVSEERFRGIFDHSNDAIFVIDPERDQILDVNGKACSMLGYPRELLLSVPVSAVHPNQMEQFQAFAQRVSATGESWTDELTCTTRSGRVVPTEISASMIDIEGKRRLVALVRDTTDRVRAEPELRIRGAAIESTLDAVLVGDADGNIVLVNSAAARMFGWSVEDLLGRPVATLIPEKLREPHRKGLARVVAGGAPRVIGRTVELEGLRADGTAFPIEMSLARVEGCDGLVFVVTARDITERKEAEAERELRMRLDAENRELLRVNEARSEFVSTVSHELKTPLTSILAFTDILARNPDGNLTSRQIDHLKVMRRSGDRLNTLIEDLLDVSRVDAGTLKLEYSQFPVRELFNEVADTFASMISERGQSLDMELPDEAWIEADRQRLAQVLTNLLSNACKYSPEGAHIELKTWREDDRLLVTITDSGIGISQQDQTRLFTPFFRADNVLTRSVAGTGLGLAITKSIVELHEGQIEVESELNAGTTFRLQIPGIRSGPSQEPGDRAARSHTRGPAHRWSLPTK